jgi:hypothetical protein
VMCFSNVSKFDGNDANIYIYMGANVNSGIYIRQCFSSLHIKNGIYISMAYT